MEQRAMIEVSDILPLSLTLVVSGIGIAFGLSVLSDQKDDIGTTDCNSDGGFWNSATDTCQVSSSNTTTLSGNSAAVNATGDAITGVAKFSSKLGLIATVIVASIVIGLLVRFLFLR